MAMWLNFCLALHTSRGAVHTAVTYWTGASAHSGAAGLTACGRKDFSIFDAADDLALGYCGIECGSVAHRRIVRYTHRDWDVFYRLPRSNVDLKHLQG